MSLPPRPGRATLSRRPGSRALGVAAAALGTLLAFAAWVISQAGARLQDVRLGEPTLEDVFIHLTGRSLR